jgi:hypothetical protein
MLATMATGPVNTAALGVGDKVAITSAQSGDKAKAVQKTAQNSTGRKIRSPKAW